VNSDRYNFRVAAKLNKALDTLQGDVSDDVECGWLFRAMNMTGWFQGWFVLEETWPDGTTRIAETEEECHRTFQRFIDSCMGGVQEARIIAERLMYEHEDLADIERRAVRGQQAETLLGFMERTSRLSERVDRSFIRALSHYHFLIDNRSAIDIKEEG
jgi:hypothetical protein